MPAGLARGEDTTGDNNQVLGGSKKRVLSLALGVQRSLLILSMTTSAMLETPHSGTIARCRRGITSEAKSLLLFRRQQHCERYDGVRLRSCAQLQFRSVAADRRVTERDSGRPAHAQ